MFAVFHAQQRHPFMHPFTKAHERHPHPFHRRHGTHHEPRTVAVEEVAERSALAEIRCAAGGAGARNGSGCFGGAGLLSWAPSPLAMPSMAVPVMIDSIGRIVFSSWAEVRL